MLSVGTFVGCCASAMTATASNITTTRIDVTAAFFIAHLVSSVIYHAEEIKESVIYTRKATGIASGKARISLRLN